MSVATASARLRVRSMRTISRALPRLSAAIAQAQPTAPTPTIPILLMGALLVALVARMERSGMRGHRRPRITLRSIRATRYCALHDIRTPRRARLFHLAAFKGAANCLKRPDPRTAPGQDVAHECSSPDRSALPAHPAVSPGQGPHTLPQAHLRGRAGG